MNGTCFGEDRYLSLEVLTYSTVICSGYSWHFWSPFLSNDTYKFILFNAADSYTEGARGISVWIVD
jgi:hypothetical protein